VDQAKLEDWILAHKREVFRLSDALIAVEENIVTAVNAIVNIAPADRPRLIGFFCMFLSCPDQVFGQCVPDYYLEFSGPE